MAKLFTCKFDTKPLGAALTKLKSGEKKAMNALLQQSADNIAQKAKSLSNIPSISGTIRVNKASGKFEISAGEGLSIPQIAAYHEFGTGDFAKALVGTLPQDWQLYAKSFYVNGMGRLPAKPYMFPALSEETIRIKNMQYLYGD